ncbi:MAG: hypothetical protein K2J33_00265, partial [Alistipes sp.]|nr:hypothetical protein [Alistipes sp.]
YRVAMCNYILNNYDEVECREVFPEEILVTDILIDYLRRHSPVAFSGRPLQDEWRVTECR